MPAFMTYTLLYDMRAYPQDYLNVRGHVSANVRGVVC